MPPALYCALFALNLLHSNTHAQLPTRPPMCLKGSIERLPLKLRDFAQAYTQWQTLMFYGPRLRTHIFPLSQSNSTCGTMSAFLQPIINGKVAPDFAWPWQAHVSAGSFECGGTLIAEQWVLTAAHCIEKKPYSPTLRVSLERLPRINGSDYDVFKQKIHVEKIFEHENFTRDTGYLLNDIALLKLKHPVTYNYRVRPVCPPPETVDLESPFVTCYITGYGNIKPGESWDKLGLMQLKVSVMGYLQCKRLWSGVLWDNHLCLRMYSRPGSGVCGGDSGGPLTCMKFGEHFFLAGVTSFVEAGCYKIRFPDVFTKVSAYVPWIRTTIMTEDGKLPIDWS